MIIGIAGDSGTGKTTLVNTLFPDSLVIECDCFHKWERVDPHWQTITHLHPEANNLDEQLGVLMNIKNEKQFRIKPYIHDTGKFGSPVLVTPRDMNIMCGLLPFYSTEHAKHYDLKIYIDVEEKLKIAMKVQRDTTQRGYTRDQVLFQIHKRSKDYNEFVHPQIHQADIVVRYSFDSSPIVSIQGFQFTLDDLSSIVDYIRLCKKYGQYVQLFQGNGGNISVKNSQTMIVKLSGSRVYDCQLYKCCATEYIDALSNECEKDIDPKASLETWFHSFTKKYTVHFHPVRYTAPEGYSVCRVKYFHPGYDIASNIHKVYKGEDVIILEKHGVICTADTIEDMITLMNFYIPQDYTSIIPVPQGWKGFKNYTPDITVMLHDKVTVKNNQFIIKEKSKEKRRDLEEILWLHLQMDEHPCDTLTPEESKFLLSWDREAYRKSFHT